LENSEIIQIIRSGEKGRNEIIRQLYKDDKLRGGIRSVTYKMGAKEDDFNDIFNTTLMQFIKTAINKKELVISSHLHTYIIGVAKNTWINIAREKGKFYTNDLEDFNDPVEYITPEKILIDEGNRTLLHEVLDKLGVNCKEVLILWASHYKMAEIAEIMTYKSADMAKKKKYQCYKKLLQIIEDNPGLRDILRL